MPKLSKACYAIRAVKSFMSQETLRMIYLFYVHSIMTYGIILWDSSSDSNIFSSHYEFYEGKSESKVPYFIATK